MWKYLRLEGHYMSTGKMKELTLLTVLIIIISSCGNFALFEELGLENLDGGITLAPASATIAVNNTLTFTASGGTSPYVFSISSGSGTIDPDTGFYTAPPGSGTDVVTVTDLDGISDSVGVLVFTPGILGISPSAITLGTNAGLTFSAIGGISPYNFTIVTGPGSINPATGLFNAGTTPGLTTVRVTDSDTPANTTDASVTITADSLSIIPPAITLSTNDVYFFVSLGGTPPYTYAITSGGGSIDGGTGEFHAPGTADITDVKVTDAAMATDSSSVTTMEGLVIVPQTVSIPANNNVAFSASGGSGPYTFTMESGAGSVTSDGFYTAPGGLGTAEIRVTDNIGSSRIATITITAPQPLNISPSSFIILTGGNFLFSAYGGTAPYNFARISGNGSISAAGSYTASGIPGIDVLRVTDFLGLTADAVVTIVSIGPLAILPTSITVEQNDDFTFISSGGTPQYSYSVISGFGFINSTTGEYTAPTALGTETIRVMDAALNTKDATVYVAPAAATNLVADGTVPGPQDIQLNWTDNATGEDGFSIERKLSGGSYTEIGTVGPNVTTYSDGLLSPNIPYSYRIRAYSLPGPVYSSYSNDDFDIPNSL